MKTRPPSIQRQLVAWLLGALGLGSLALVGVAYLFTLHEIDEVFADSLRRTAVFLAGRDLPAATQAPGPPGSRDSSELIAIAWRRDGTLLFASDPAQAIRFDARSGPSRQNAAGVEWNVYTVVQDDRIVQVAQPTWVGREEAAESASRLLLPLIALIGLTAALLVLALKRGLRPLHLTSAALAQRSAASLAPLDTRPVPVEVLPLVRAFNDMLARVSAAFESQQRFIADAAHELRSPIAALQLQAQLLERSPDPAERADATRELCAGIARTRRLTEQLLYLSRATATADDGAPLRRAPVDLRALAHEAVVRWSGEARRRGIDLGAAGDAAAVWTQGDAGQIERLLDNLIENALRYGRAGGVVDVIAQRNGATPELRVVDDGPGIAESEKARVFDRFYRSPLTAAGTESGSGLGLAIVRAIAEQHDGCVTLRDGRNERGLEVCVAFAEPAAGSPRGAMSPPDAGAG